MDYPKRMTWGKPLDRFTIHTFDNNSGENGVEPWCSRVRSDVQEIINRVYVEVKALQQREADSPGAELIGDTFLKCVSQRRTTRERSRKTAATPRVRHRS